MKNRFLLLLMIMISCAVTSRAQSLDEEPTICDELRQGGRVTIDQDPRLEALLTRSHKVYNAASRKLRGMHPGNYSLSIFAGNQQQASHNEALRLQGVLKDYDSELVTVVFFDTPFWRLWAGDYGTMEEATAAMRTLKKKFPAFGKEIVIKRIPE